MDLKEKLTITIGISALNEEKNIQNILKNLLAQSDNNYKLLEIIIFSDGSSDNTVQKIKDLHDDKISVYDDGRRLGKIKRINSIFELAKGDVIVLIDADVIPTSKDTLDKLVLPFVNDDNLDYASGEITLLKPTNFLSKSVAVSRSVWDKLRIVLKNGNSIYTCHGALYALRATFAKAYPFPETVWADIGFHYLICLKNKHKYLSVSDASVFVKQPVKINDYINQISRYQREDLALIEYFGPDIKNEYYIPKSLLYKYKLEAFVSYPLHTLLIFVLNFYAKYFYKSSKKTAVADWTMINSTKESLTNAN